MNVRWSDDADRDRGDIAARIWAASPQAALAMDALFTTAASRLETFPRLGKQGYMAGTRELFPHPTYRLVYQVADEEVVILSIVHTSRQWPPEPPVEDDA